jgi:creatinine amidohydrolase
MKAYQMNDHEIRASKDKIKQVLIPVGSLEQHGGHLPISTDSIIIESIANAVAEKIPLLVLPTIPYGISFEHKPFFNISLSSTTLSMVISEICLSLYEYELPKIIILNGHHGNKGILQYISQSVERSMLQKSNIYSINYWQLLDRDFDHAGFVETSLMLAIRPDLVNMTKASKGSVARTILPAVTSSFLNTPSSFIKIAKTGVLGNPMRASPKQGKKLLNNLTKNIIAAIHQFNDLST